MKILTDAQKIKELLTRGAEEIIETESIEKKLNSKKQLRIKLGIDPTSPNIHIGRSIPLLKLKDFQELGHKIVLIIGDFTGVIGDTSDKDSERPMLNEDQVEKNMETYIEQAKKIINIKECEVRYNSEWLKKLNYYEICKQADNFSLNEFISRENIKRRLDAGKRISLRELLYPLMQSYDSVIVKADVEVGGTDQRFNLLAGREMQRYYKQKPQDVITNPLIEGLDGRKMSSSWGNTINLFDSASEMYGKIMSLRDELIIKYFILATRVSLAEIDQYKKELTAGGNPKNYKMKLALEIVKAYHDEKAAEMAGQEFQRVFKEKGLPFDIPEILIKEKEINILDLLIRLKIASSKTEARRLIEQGGVAIGSELQKDWRKIVKIKKGEVVRAGKRKFAKII
ncbi:MAG: tyrosine--tRNA ligase [Candidatus Nealsonbacteria bacterium]